MSSLAYRVVVVDDIDSRIRYNGSWFSDKGSQDSLGNLSAPFRSTLHGTQANSSLEFQYNGAGVEAYGTMHVQNVSGVLDPTFECLFDGRLVERNYINESFLGNNVELCRQDVAPDGLHTLTIKATVMTNETFWFDAIRYVPPASAPLDQETIIVAHGDPQVQYGEGWQDGATSRNGSIFTFEFIGISISAYGYTGPLNPSPAIYSIDGQDPIDFVVPSTPVGSTNQKIFEIAQLPAGPHSLRVTYQGNSNSAALWLDYFIVQNGTLSSTATSVSSHATGSNGVASTSTPGTSSGNDVSGTSTPDSTPVGAIVGGVIGGLVLIIFVILALLLLLRRRKRRAAEEEIVSTTPQPFDFGHATLHPSNSTPNDSLSVQQSTLATRKPLLAPLLVSRPSPSGAGRKAEVLAVPESQRQGDTLVPAMVSMQGNNIRSPDVVVHEDSGIRMPPSTPATNGITEVPPLYTVD